MFYYLYQITNKVDNKIYIGVHKTLDMSDGYMGSGKILGNAIKKHGIENFSKVILETFDNSKDMYTKEKEIVNDEFLSREDTYNLRRGGTGGFDHINKSGIPKFSGKKHTEETKQKIREKRIGVTHHIPDEDTKLKISNSKLGKSTKLKGSSKSEEHKRKISEAIQKKWVEKKQRG